MSKEEFYETYIKDNRTEDEKMMDIIHSNAKKDKTDKYIQESRNHRKKGVKTILRGVYLTDGIIIVLLIALLVKIWR